MRNKEVNMEIKNINKLTIDDIKSLYDNEDKVATLETYTDWSKDTLDVCEIKGNEILNLPKEFNRDKNYEFYRNGIRDAVDNLINLIVKYEQNGEKEKVDALLNIFNTCVKVKKVDNIVFLNINNVDPDLDPMEFSYEKFDGYVLDTREFSPILTKYIEYKYDNLTNKTNTNDNAHI